MFDRSSADAFVSVYLDECPVRVLGNEFLIVLLLKFKGSGLSYIVSRNTDIDGNSLRCFGIVIVNRFFCRGVLVL